MSEHKKRTEYCNHQMNVTECSCWEWCNLASTCKMLTIAGREWQKNKKLYDRREKLAELEHIQWAHWTKYMLDNLTPENRERWKQQVKTMYKDLSEKEKDADRKWADKVIDIIDGAE